jgi:hypothetical protein
VGITKSIQGMRLALSNGLNRVGVSPISHLRTEEDPASETMCYFVLFRTPDDGQSPRTLQPYTDSLVIQRHLFNIERQDLRKMNWKVKVAYVNKCHCPRMIGGTEGILWKATGF